MNFTKTQVLIMGVTIVVVVFFVLVFIGVIPGLQEEGTPPLKAELEIWTVFEPLEASRAYTQTFNGWYPKVRVNYRRFNDLKEYEETLLEAFAAGKGPDIFMVHNRDLFRNANKIMPVPKEKISLLELRERFPQVVESDFSSQGYIYALPISIDTLALFYNKDLLDTAAVPVPQTWEDFQTAVAQLRALDTKGNVVRAGAAIGGSESNIDHAADILSLLMLQSGTQMIASDFRSATFDSNEGVRAMDFYTSFAQPNTPYYTWSPLLPNARDLFAQEKAAMIFDYASAIPEIKRRNSFLNFDFAAVPQPKDSVKAVTYPSYWGYTVSRQSKYADIAWNYILFFTALPEQAETYVKATGNPPALRSLLTKYAQDPTLSVFARQALTARSWFEGDPKEAEAAFSDAIQAVLNGELSPEGALQKARTQITRLLEKRF